MKKFWKVAGTVLKILAAVGAVVLFVVLLGRFNVGGFLGKLFGGGRDEEDEVKVANSIPDDRVDGSGAPIPHGQPDDHGFTQWVVHETETSKNPLRDKTKLEIVVSETITSQDGFPVGVKVKKKKLSLPKGVEDTDVKKVVEVRPDVFVVEVRDASKVRASDLLEQLP